MAERTPWALMMAAALRLGIGPRNFWQLSLREWRGLATVADAALTRETFAALAQRFPDKVK